MDEVAAESCRACGAPVRIKLRQEEPTPGQLRDQLEVVRICTSLICETNMHPHGDADSVFAP